MLTESEYLNLVERVQQALCIEPFRLDIADVMTLVSEWRLLTNKNRQLRFALMAGRATHGELCQAGNECPFIQDANAALGDVQ